MTNTTSRIVAEVARIVADDSQRNTRNDAALAGQLAGDIVGAFLAMGPDRRREMAHSRGAVARQVVSALLSVDLGDYQSTEPPDPWYAEDWAGPVAGPTVLERTYGIPRSTLYKWQRDGHVLAIPKGRRKFVFPLRQFVDGRPVPGLRVLATHFEDHRAAWAWLIAEHPAIGEPPIERLRHDDQKSVFDILP